MTKLLRKHIRSVLSTKQRKLIKLYLAKWNWRLKYKLGFNVPIPVGGVKFGSLRRLNPVSEIFGVDRGRNGKNGIPIDRYYVEDFLARYSNDIKGRVLEFGDNHSTLEHGNNRVTKSDVLNLVEGEPETTIVADITKAGDISSDAFDCIIMTHTIQMIYDQRAAIQHLYRILKPGGVLLVSTHGLSRIGRHEGEDPWAVHWRMTTYSARQLFEEYFPPDHVEVEGHGNVLVAIAFLHGLEVHELDKRELDYYDNSYQILLNIRAIKPQNQ